MLIFWHCADNIAASSTYSVFGLWFSVARTVSFLIYLYKNSIYHRVLSSCEASSWSWGLIQLYLLH